MLIDTHTHVNFTVFKDDNQEVIKRSLAADTWLINVGSQYSTSRRAVELAEQYDQGVYAVVGLHPIHLYDMAVDEAEQDIHFNSRAEIFSVERYTELLASPKAVGIGEMGIDYFHLPPEEDTDSVKHRQKETFQQGIKLAQAHNLPYIIHTRPSSGSFDAYEDVMKIIADSGYTKGVVHCFGGTLEQARDFIDMGLLVSFTGIVTFKNAKDLQAIVKQVPLDKMMVETDAPYLSPEPFRGKRNEPAYVEYVARQVAMLKGVSFEEVAETTTATARKFFNI